VSVDNLTGVGPDGLEKAPMLLSQEAEAEFGGEIDLDVGAGVCGGRPSDRVLANGV